MPRFTLRYLMLCVSLLAIDMGTSALLFERMTKNSVELIVVIWCAFGVIAGAAMFARVNRVVAGALFGAIFQFVLALFQAMKFQG
jgi:hypothetical protein